MAEMPRSEDLFLMLKRISWTLTAQLELRLKERNMRGTQVYFLVYLLRRHPQGTYLTELSREIGLSKSTLSPLIKRLRESGYLCVQENPSDVRRKRVCPTEKLLAEQRELLEKAGRMERELDTALNQRERLQLWRLGRKLLEHLEQPDGSGYGTQYETDRRMLEREEHMESVKTI